MDTRPLLRLSRCSLALIRSVAIELLRMSAGGVADNLTAVVCDCCDEGGGGGGGLSLPTSRSSMLALAAHLSRLLPGLLLLLPASRSLKSRPSPLESALPMLRFWGDMHTSGPLHSSEAEEEDDCEDETAAAAAAELTGRLLCRGVARGVTPWWGEPKDVACGDMRDRCGDRCDRGTTWWPACGWGTACGGGGGGCGWPCPPWGGGGGGPLWAWWWPIAARLLMVKLVGARLRGGVK